MQIALLMLAAQALGCVHAQTQAELTQCAAAAATHADTAMNQQWKLTLAEMHKQDRAAAGDPTRTQGPGYADALLASQRAWLQFRDVECRIEGYAARGGSMQPMLVGQCLDRLTTARTKRLAELAKAD